MDGPDYRMMQEAEESRMLNLLAILDRVASGQTNEKDAADLAAELGLQRHYSTRHEKEMT